MSFTARFRGWCSECRQSIEPGDLIRYAGLGSGAAGMVEHETCQATPARRPEVTCPDCTMIKPCECDDL